MFAIAASRCAPRVRVEGSLKFPSSVPVDVTGAGDGVAGAFEVVLDAGAGAAGGAGVDVTAGVGVEGVLAEKVPDELAGAVLGYFLWSGYGSVSRENLDNHTFDVMQTMNPFSSI